MLLSIPVGEPLCLEKACLLGDRELMLAPLCLFVKWV